MSVFNTESDRKGITIAFNKEFDVKNGTLKKMLLYSKMDLNSQKYPKIILYEFDKKNPRVKYNIYLDKKMNETKDILFGHFFEILIDSSNCVHCFLNEVLFKG